MAKKTISKRKPVGLWTRAAWRFWRRRRIFGEFHARIGAQASRLEGMHPWCQQSVADRRALVAKLSELSAGVARLNADATPEEIKSLGGRIAQAEQNTDELLRRDGEWAEHYRRIQTETGGLRERASIIPGREFAKRSAQLATALSQSPDPPPALRGGKKKAGSKTAHPVKPAAEYFREAELRLIELREHVQTAEKAIKGIEELKADIARIDDLGVQLDVASAQEYERLLATREVIEQELSGGRYQGASFHLQGARRLSSQLRQALQNRFALTRAQIDLWLDDDTIRLQFDLLSFPKRLTAADAQRWQDLRIEIAAAVNARAGKARKAHAAAFQSNKKLQASLDDLKDWGRLEVFARASVHASKH